MKKKTLTALAVILTISLMVPAVLPINQAKADYLPPLSCVTAAEFGWNKVGWNWLCLIQLEVNCCDPMGDPWY